MVSARPRRGLIVNADDFGLSSEVNSAVLQAHTHGILTSASLMVNEPGFEEAVEIARSYPSLGVGLHLTLCLGRAALPPERIPSLVRPNAQFTSSPVLAGLKYFFSKTARQQLLQEMEAQFERFASTGLKLDHVNGHLQFHLHPTVFELLLQNCKRWNVRALRLTLDPATLDLPLGQGRWLYRLSHAWIFARLARRARPKLAHHRIHHTQHVFGMLENARIGERYILDLLPLLQEGVSELYAHPNHSTFQHELVALTSRRVRSALLDRNIELLRYQDL